MRPEELDETLVVFSVRDPVARAISGYNYLRNVIKRPDVLAFNSINEWISSERAWLRAQGRALRPLRSLTHAAPSAEEHAWDFRNGLATLLAHQQPGCRKDCGIPDAYAPPRSDLELLQQAGHGAAGAAAAEQPPSRPSSSSSSSSSCRRSSSSHACARCSSRSTWTSRRRTSRTCSAGRRTSRSSTSTARPTRRTPPTACRRCEGCGARSRSPDAPPSSLATPHAGPRQRRQCRRHGSVL